MVTLNGSCLCGEIKYEVSGEPVLKATCHCTSCQKGTESPQSTHTISPYITLPLFSFCRVSFLNLFRWIGFETDVDLLETGSAFASDIVFPANSIKFTSGKPKTYNERGSSGKFVKHNFCSNCGSSVYGVLEVLVSYPPSPLSIPSPPQSSVP